MDVKGQMSIEYLFIIGFMFMIMVSTFSLIGESNELNRAMAAARSGAIEGSNVDSFAIYPEEAFSDYTSKHPRLLGQSSVMIIRINYQDQGFNQFYNKTKIQLKITASAPSVTNSSDKNALGDRINFHVRKSICEAFGTQKSDK